MAHHQGSLFFRQFFNGHIRPPRPWVFNECVFSSPQMQMCRRGNGNGMYLRSLTITSKSVTVSLLGRDSSFVPACPYQCPDRLNPAFPSALKLRISLAPCTAIDNSTLSISSPCF
jgi:hypothetical protein